MLYEYKGTVHRIGAVETVGKKGFQKREIVLEPETQGKFPTFGVFTLNGKDKVGLADNLSKGDAVTVRFAVDGREWEDRKTGKTRYFSSLSAIKIEKAGGGGNTVSHDASQTGRTVPEPPAEVSPAEDPDLPF